MSAFLEALDPKYRQVFENLINNLGNGLSLKAYHDALKSFAESYMMPWQLWERALAHKNYYGDKHYMHLFSLYQFFYPRSDEELLWDSQEYFAELLLLFHQKSEKRKRVNITYFNSETGKSSGKVDLLIHDLQVPHCDLYEIWKLYEKNICSPPPQSIVNTYKKMRKLYDKIISVQSDEEKWINAMMETQNVKFVRQNVEYRIGGDLNNKKLWKLYIKFLRENDIDKMLQTYSKYCRYFLSDNEMLEKYRREVKKHGNLPKPEDMDWWNYLKSFFFKPQPVVAVPWKKLFDFEIYDENVLKNYEYRLPEVNEMTFPEI